MGKVPGWVLDHPVSLYAQKVLHGDIVAGKYVALACERHLRDLEDGPDRGFVFSDGYADKAINFIQGLRHYKGQWAGKPIELELWQKFIVGSVFGWVRWDGVEAPEVRKLRRYRRLYQEIGKKNGKTISTAGIGLYLLAEDGEAGAEVYAAATQRDQARLLFRDAEKLARKHPTLRGQLKILANSISDPMSSSVMLPVSRDAKTLDGKNASAILIDEYAAHPTDEVVEALETGTAAREQPLTAMITTGGSNVNGPCYRERTYCMGVLEGVYTDQGADETFAYIAAPDKDDVEGDGWLDPAVWQKANPNYGVSVSADYLKSKTSKAKSSTTAKVSFLQKHLNVWTQAAGRWLDLDDWNAAAELPMLLEDGESCFGGLDLAKVKDLSSLQLLFEPRPGRDYWVLLGRFWVPEDNIEKRSKNDRVSYPQWVEQGFITATPGNTTDYSYIERDVKELGGQYDIREIAYDRMFAGQLVNNLVDEGLTMVPFGQGFLSMAAPTAEFERLVINRNIAHGGNPVMAWCVGNTVVSRDAVDNMKPDKEKSFERIDGTVAAIMGLGRATVHKDQEDDGIPPYFGMDLDAPFEAEA